VGDSPTDRRGNAGQSTKPKLIRDTLISAAFNARSIHNVRPRFPDTMHHGHLTAEVIVAISAWLDPEMTPQDAGGDATMPIFGWD
jgi:hypothetical protein